MITKENILSASGAELSRLAGQVLQPEKNRHTIPHGSYERGNCVKCGVNLDWSQWHKECISVDPIALTPDNQVKWRDWAVENFDACEFHDAMLEVFMYEMEYADGDFPPKSEFVHWVATAATPEHYIKAACLCKIESE